MASSPAASTSSSRSALSATLRSIALAPSTWAKSRTRRNRRPAIRGTPRIAGRLLRRVRDFAHVDGAKAIDRQVADKALRELEVDAAGLDAMDRRYLTTIAENYGGVHFQFTQRVVGNLAVDRLGAVDLGEGAHE